MATLEEIQDRADVFGYIVMPAPLPSKIASEAQIVLELWCNGWMILKTDTLDQIAVEVAEVERLHG